MKLTADTITDSQIHELRDSVPRGHIDALWCDDALASSHHPVRRRNARSLCAENPLRQGAAMTRPIRMNEHARISARIYCDALLEACAKVKADPLRALTETDEFPRLMKMSGVEFAIGWLHGCAESHEITVEALWTEINVPRCAWELRCLCAIHAKGAAFDVPCDAREDVRVPRRRKAG